MNHILVVGSLAYDTIETPFGKVDKTLGGSANYFSVAASHFAPIRVVGVVGDDYSDADKNKLSSRNVDLAGLQRAHGKTFHWSGFYGQDLNEAQTKKTDLNVFETFNPSLPETYKSSEFVFLANIDPDLQLRVLEQVSKPVFVASDSMNLWINIKKPALLKVLERVHGLLINEGEAKLLTQTQNAVAAAKKIIEYGPKFVVIKRGEYGFLMYSQEGYFMLPAVPIAEVVDPTGAGDTFAGGFIGYLASVKNPFELQELKNACKYGTVMSSFTVQGFGLTSLEKVTHDEIQKRLQYFWSVTN